MKDQFQPMNCESLPDPNVNPSMKPFTSTHSFLPPFLLRNSHVQTLTGAYLFGRWANRFTDHSIKTVKGTVDLGDGDSLVFHDDRPAEWHEGDRVVVLLHGLSGSYLSPYMIRTAGRLNRLNVRTFRLDWRGSGAGISLARYPYHSGRSEDLRATLKRIRQDCPNSPISVVGFSMGGNVALKFLGEGDAEDPVRLGVEKAVAVCPPIDLSRTIKSIQAGTALLYNRYFAKSCIRDVRRRKQLFPEAIIPDGWLEKPPRDMWEFDDTFTAPVCGFASAEDYYGKSSSNQFLPRIRVPSLVIAAQDDPLIPFGQFQDASYSNETVLRAPNYGGHVGFVTMTGAEWLDHQIINWIMERA